MHLFSLRKTYPKRLAALIAKRRVERGIRWLNMIRPYDWWKPFYTENGRFWARDEYNNECPLALAFQAEKKLRVYGEVTYASVANHLRLSCRWLLAHGFTSPYGTPAHGPQVTSSMLNRSWEQELRQSPLIIRAPRHFPAIPLSQEKARQEWIQELIPRLRIRGILSRILPPRAQRA